MCTDVRINERYSIIIAVTVPVAAYIDRHVNSHDSRDWLPLVDIWDLSDAMNGIIEIKESVELEDAVVLEV